LKIRFANGRGSSVAPSIFAEKLNIMNIAIVGGRDFSDYELLKTKLTEFISENNESEHSIVSGGAKGADAMAEKFASEMNLEIIVFKPDYKRYGRGATIVRNTQIIENADVVFAFWNGVSKGTFDSIKKAEKSGKKLVVVSY